MTVDYVSLHISLLNPYMPGISTGMINYALFVCLDLGHF